ncbi:hypothetical protein [Kineococcus glutinatus]|uniref:Major facilitator superfamily (MFS) profile domain-containing protein n=1 Tax=Kineococcus glutinatus TaxID=1070872 RepID=A0ABP9H3E9_9ACTN
MSTASGSHVPGERPGGGQGSRAASSTDPDPGISVERKAGATSMGRLGLDRVSVVNREKEQFGGVKVGSAFFGWLTATGTAVLLTALLTGAGAAVGAATDTDAATAADGAGDNIATVGLFGAIALLVVLFVAYFAGGYVAGRMARFNGAKQGVAVWLWAVVIAVVVAVVTAVAGSRFDLLGRLGSFPTLPVSGQDLSTAAIVTAVVAVLVALAGAVLGGLTGMRFHRRVDRAGLGR